jgi:hypothetical protein
MIVPLLTTIPKSLYEKKPNRCNSFLEIVVRDEIIVSNDKNIKNRCKEPKNHCITKSLVARLPKSL